MASLTHEILTASRPETVWDAIRDIGALHTRLVPGFVVKSELIPGGRRVTFDDGLVIEEPVVDLDEALHRLVWTSVGTALRHYHASLQVFPREGGGSRIEWTTYFLPHEAAALIEARMTRAAAAMARALNGGRAT